MYSEKVKLRQINILSGILLKIRIELLLQVGYWFKGKYGHYAFLQPKKKSIKVTHIFTFFLHPTISPKHFDFI